MTVLLQTFGALWRLWPGVVGIVLLGGLLLAEPGSAWSAPAETAPAAVGQSESCAAAPAARPVFAAWYHQILGDRTRMIQVTIIVMIVGIVILMWTRGK